MHQRRAPLDEAHRAMFRMARDRGHFHGRCKAGNRVTACADHPSGFIATCAFHYRDNDENATAI
ncbi:protein of unknown function [Burkholderia multivorans]